jgi:translation factor ATP22
MYIRGHLVRQKRLSRLIRNHATLVPQISAKTPNKTLIARPSPAITDAEQPPKLRIRPFSRRSEEKHDDYSKLLLNTYPNPLHTMSTKALVELSVKDLQHLLKISYRDISELDEFCTKIISIVNNEILENPIIAAKFVINLQDHEIFPELKFSILKLFEKDRIKLSIFHYILSPESQEFRVGFFQILSDILHMKQKSYQEKSDLLLTYFDKISSINIINKVPILLNDDFYSKIMKTVGPIKFNELFSYFVYLNIQTKDLLLIKSLKKTLENGSEVDRFIARTGWINPIWNNILKVKIPPKHRCKMVHFYSIDDFQRFANQAIQNHDIILGNLYLSLLVEKFEIKCQQIEKNAIIVNDSSVSEDIQTLLEVILNHVMEFKGSDYSVTVLRYMNENQLQIKFSTLLILMRQFRLKSKFEDALLIMNNINMFQMTDIQRKQLVHEVLLLIKKRYPKSPKILIGYCASIFNNVECNGLELLNDLGIIGITHGSGNVSKISDLGLVQKANLDSKLSGFKFTHTALANVYETILSTTPRSLSCEFITKLYELYISQIDKNRFVDINDRVINKFINFLLRKLAGGKINFQFYKNSERYEISKRIFLDFHNKTCLKRIQTTTSLFDLLIHVSLTYHQDHEFASTVIKLSRKMSVTPTFNQIYPFIQFHYNRKEYDIAHLWYKELVKQAVKTTAPPSKELFRIARELNWDVNGFVNRKLMIHRNYKSRKEILKLENDPVLFINDQDTEDLITEELITDSAGSTDLNFSQELSSILYGSSLSIK